MRLDVAAELHFPFQLLDGFRPQIPQRDQSEAEHEGEDDAAESHESADDMIEKCGRSVCGTSEQKTEDGCARSPGEVFVRGPGARLDVRRMWNYESVFEAAPGEVVVDSEREEADGGEDGAVAVDGWEEWGVGHS